MGSLLPLCIYLQGKDIRVRINLKDKPMRGQGEKKAGFIFYLIDFPGGSSAHCIACITISISRLN